MNNSNELFSHKETSENYNKTLSYIESLDIGEDLVTRRDFFGSLNDIDFIDILGSVASLVQNNLNIKVANFDGEYIHAIDCGVPDGKSEKTEIIKETWQTAKYFLDDYTISDRDALNFAAITVYGGITLCHPFKDGNGRSSRLLSYMIASGTPDCDVFKNTLSRSGGFGKKDTLWNFDIGKKFYTSDKDSFEGSQPDIIDINEDKRKECRYIFNEGVIRFLIEKHGEDNFIKGLLEDNTKINDDQTVLDSEGFIDNLFCDTTDLEKAQLNNNFKEIYYSDRARGFFRAMKSSSSKLKDGNNLIHIYDIDNTYGVHSAENAKLALSHFDHDVDVDNTGSIGIAIDNLPLREQFVVDRARYMPSLLEIN